MSEDKYVIIIVKDPEFYGLVGIVRKEEENELFVELLITSALKVKTYLRVLKTEVKNLFHSSGKFSKPFKRISSVQILGINSPYKGVIGEYRTVNSTTLMMSVDLDFIGSPMINVSFSNVKFLPLKELETYEINKPSSIDRFENYTLYSYNLSSVVAPGESKSRSKSKSKSHSRTSRSISSSRTKDEEINNTGEIFGYDEAVEDVEENIAFSVTKDKNKNKAIEDYIDSNKEVDTILNGFYIILGVVPNSDIIQAEFIKNLYKVLDKAVVKDNYDIKMFIISYLYIKLNQHVGLTDYFNVYIIPSPTPIIPLTKNFKTLFYTAVRLSEVRYFEDEKITRSHDVFLELQKNVKKVLVILNIDPDLFLRA